MAVYGMGSVFAPVVGPTLGGWITDNYTWRWIFLINVPVGICSLLLTSLLIFDPPYLIRKTLRDGLKVDYIGLGLLATGLGSLEIMLDEGQRNDWFSSPGIVAAAVIAACGLIGVVAWELRQKEPVVDFRLLKDRTFTISTAAMFILGFVLYGSTMALPLFLQTLLGYTAMQSGLALSPGGLMIMVMMPMVGILLSKFQARWLIIFGLIASSVGLFQMSHFDTQINFGHAVSARVVQSFGLAFLFVPINTVAFSFIARANTGYATGLINLARNMGGSSGIAICTTLIARREQFHQQVLIGHLSASDPTYQSTLAGMEATVNYQRRGPRTGGRASVGDDLRQHAATSRHALVQRSLLGSGRVVSDRDPADVLHEENRAGQGCGRYRSLTAKNSEDEFGMDSILSVRLFPLCRRGCESRGARVWPRRPHASPARSCCLASRAARTRS
jgi:DHA2 family multidrug resistance protein